MTPKGHEEKLEVFVQKLQEKTPEELKQYVDSRFGLLEDLLLFVKEKIEFLKTENEYLISKIGGLENKILDLKDQLYF